MHSLWARNKSVNFGELARFFEKWERRKDCEKDPYARNGPQIKRIWDSLFEGRTRAYSKKPEISKQRQRRNDGWGNGIETFWFYAQNHKTGTG